VKGAKRSGTSEKKNLPEDRGKRCAEQTLSGRKGCAVAEHLQCASDGRGLMSHKGRSSSARGVLSKGPQGSGVLQGSGHS